MHILTSTTQSLDQLLCGWQHQCWVWPMIGRTVDRIRLRLFPLGTQGDQWPSSGTLLSLNLRLSRCTQIGSSALSVQLRRIACLSHLRDWAGLGSDWARMSDLPASQALYDGIRLSSFLPARPWPEASTFFRSTPITRSAVE